MESEFTHMSKCSDVMFLCFSHQRLCRLKKIIKIGIIFSGYNYKLLWFHFMYCIFVKVYIHILGANNTVDI